MTNEPFLLKCPRVCQTPSDVHTACFQFSKSSSGRDFILSFSVTHLIEYVFQVRINSVNNVIVHIGGNTHYFWTVSGFYQTAQNHVLSGKMQPQFFLILQPMKILGRRQTWVNIHCNGSANLLYHQEQLVPLCIPPGYLWTKTINKDNFVNRNVCWSQVKVEELHCILAPNFYSWIKNEIVSSRFLLLHSW